MPLRKVLDKLLTELSPAYRLLLEAAAAMLFASSMPACESDATDIDVTAGQEVKVMTSVFTPSAPISVHLTSSVPYSSSDLYATVGGARISLTVNGERAETAVLAEGQTTAQFASRNLQDNDTVAIKALIDDGDELEASAVVMPKISIESVDTSTSIDKHSLRFSLTMTDPAETSDFYLIEVHRTYFSAGEATDTVVKCNYTSRVFHDLANGISASDAIGLFLDERLVKNGEGHSTLRLSVPWQRLMPAADSSSTDSTVVAIRLYHLSEDYYNFLNTSSNSDNHIWLPVFGSSAVSTNVSGGYGIVACAVYDERRFKIRSADDSQ